MRKVILCVLTTALWLCGGFGQVGPRRMERVAVLPDSAYAAIETDSSGRKLRHLPHHDASGKVDIPLLIEAMRQWKSVHWRDPRNAKAALEHLKKHMRELNFLPAPEPGKAPRTRKTPGSPGISLLG